MLVFVIPLKSKATSNSWGLVSRLLERALRSICNQTSPLFEIVVVCNERPDIDFQHPKIHYVDVNFPPPEPLPEERSQLVGYEHIMSADIARKNVDKAKRLLKGIEFAAQFKPTHIMVVDADDCVSCHLAEFVAQHPHDDGWFMNKGYMYKEGSPYLYINVKRFHHVSGTSFIIRYPLYPQVFLGDSHYYPCRDDFPGTNIQPLPFKGALYSMLNGENILMSINTFSQMRHQIFTSLPKFLEKLTRYRIWWLTPSIIREFGLYSVNPNG
jgi:hypothetical protein